MPHRKKYPSWQRRYEGVLIWLLEHPTAKLSDCARVTGYSPSQISRIVNSPEFKQRMQAAMNAMVDESIRRFACGDVVPIEKRSWGEILR